VDLGWGQKTKKNKTSNKLGGEKQTPKKRGGKRPRGMGEVPGKRKKITGTRTPVTNSQHPNRKETPRKKKYHSQTKRNSDTRRTSRSNGGYPTKLTHNGPVGGGGVGVCVCSQQEKKKKTQTKHHRHPQTTRTKNPPDGPNSTVNAKTTTEETGTVAQKKKRKASKKRCRATCQPQS